MSRTVHIVGTATREHSSDAVTFYRDYWHVGDRVTSEADAAHDELLAALFGRPPQGLAILEIGPGGEGGLIRRLQPTNRVHGLDVSQSAIDCCRQWGLDVRLCHAGVDPFPYPDDTFDVIFAFEVCEHLANPQFAIEEVRRVLKPGGRFVASTPNPLIHHWPRCFYPSLVERDAFREFLQVNQLAVVREITVGDHRYAHLVGGAHEGWSWVWDCRAIKADAAALRATALELWRRTDAHGIRTRPIEAADLARAALARDPDDIEARGLLAAASVYRVISGESVECQAALDRIVACCASPDAASLTAARYWLVAVDAELRRFGLGVLSDDQLPPLLGAVRSVAPGRAAELDEALARAKTFARA